ncbi:MAG: hypothetical protein O7I42_16100, partial [Alphaproteobacteria bacterium]|nr:hypothetical protein [Alphaproteobacteria bacterium]
SPAGANIGAVTPEEIALSILTDIVQERRLGTAEDDRKNASHSAASAKISSSSRTPRNEC